MYKHPFVYEAIKEAIDAFKKTNGFNPVDMIVDELNYKGEHRRQQLYNKLSNYTDKYIKIDEFIIICDLLDSAKDIPLRALVNHFGYDIVPQDALERCSVVELVLRTNIELEVELGEFAKEVMAAIEDGEIDYDEAASLKRKIKEFRSILDRLDGKLQEIMEL